MQIPDEILGRFEIHETLGEGGMGVVYRATQRSLGRPVALKLLSHHASADREFCQRFIDEARLTARIRHPGIVQVLDFDVVAGVAYIVYELIQGRSLASILEPGPLPPERARLIAIDLFSGLAALHREGIVHRDVKPSNVLVDATDRAILVDLGIARDLAGRIHRTRTGQMLGTPEYMAPEQVRGESPTPATDVYASGVLLYVLAVGHPPFEAPVLFDLLKAHLESPVPPPRTVRPGADPLLSSLALAALEKEPSRRPTIDELLRSLRRAPAGEPASSQRPGPGSKRATPEGEARPGTVRIASRAASDRSTLCAPVGAARAGPTARRVVGIALGAVLLVGLIALRPPRFGHGPAGRSAPPTALASPSTGETGSPAAAATHSPERVAIGRALGLVQEAHALIEAPGRDRAAGSGPSLRSIVEALQSAVRSFRNAPPKRRTGLWGWADGRPGLAELLCQSALFLKHHSGSDLSGLLDREFPVMGDEAAADDPLYWMSRGVWLAQGLTADDLADRDPTMRELGGQELLMFALNLALQRADSRPLSDLFEVALQAMDVNEWRGDDAELRGVRVDWEEWRVLVLHDLLDRLHESRAAVPPLLVGRVHALLGSVHLRRFQYEAVVADHRLAREALSRLRDRPTLNLVDIHYMNELEEPAGLAALERAVLPGGRGRPVSGPPGPGTPDHGTGGYVPEGEQAVSALLHRLEELRHPVDGAIPASSRVTPRRPSVDVLEKLVMALARRTCPAGERPKQDRVARSAAEPGGLAAGRRLHESLNGLIEAVPAWHLERTARAAGPGPDPRSGAAQRALGRGVVRLGLSRSRLTALVPERLADPLFSTSPATTTTSPLLGCLDAAATTARRELTARWEVPGIEKLMVLAKQLEEQLEPFALVGEGDDRSAAVSRQVKLLELLADELAALVRTYDRVGTTGPAWLYLLDATSVALGPFKKTEVLSTLGSRWTRLLDRIDRSVGVVPADPWRQAFTALARSEIRWLRRDFVGDGLPFAAELIDWCGRFARLERPPGANDRVLMERIRLLKVAGWLMTKIRSKSGSDAGGPHRKLSELTERVLDRVDELMNELQRSGASGALLWVVSLVEIDAQVFASTPDRSVRQRAVTQAERLLTRLPATPVARAAPAAVEMLNRLARAKETLSSAQGLSGPESLSTTPATR